MPESFEEVDFALCAGDTANDLNVVALVSSDCTGAVERTERLNEVIRDEAAFKKALQESGAQETPTVDFEESVVIAAHAGYQSQCGNTISVTAANDTGKTVEIEVTTTLACAGDDAESWPYTFVQVPRLEKPYEFIAKEVAEVCD
jgi:hypothetical protein